MITVLLVDDHELVRCGLRGLLESRAGYRVLGEAASGEAAVEQVARLKPDVVLMDVNMPGIGGIEATRRICALGLDSRVIAVTAHADNPFPSTLHQAGALGYLNKDCSIDELFHAVDLAMGGQPFFSSKVAQNLSRSSLTHQGSPFDQLSSREMEILMLIVSGRKNQEIADTLFLSPKTVTTYRLRLQDKLQVANDVELTLLAMRYGLVQ